MKKPSFLERLTGASQNDEYDRVLGEDEDFEGDELSGNELYEEEEGDWHEEPDQEHSPQEGELPVDMYQTDDAIVIRLGSWS